MARCAEPQQCTSSPLTTLLTQQHPPLCPHVPSPQASTSRSSVVGVRTASLPPAAAVSSTGFLNRSFMGGTLSGAPTEPPGAPTELLLRAAGLRPIADPEAAARALSKAHHLHLQGRGLTHLASLRACPRLEVAYLYDNHLPDLSCLAANKLVTHLYIQNNQLTSLAGCSKLPLLQKLYAQGNCLTSVGHMEGCSRLVELHVSHQRPLPPVLAVPTAAAAGEGSSEGSGLLMDTASASSSMAGLLPERSFHSPRQQQQQLVLLEEEQEEEEEEDSGSRGPGDQGSSFPRGGLTFCPLSLAAVSSSLRVLVAVGCGITDPSLFTPLVHLTTLDLAHNAIAAWAPLAALLGATQRLEVLDTRGNPLAAGGPRYRDAVIRASGRRLGQLDGAPVAATHRAFLMNAAAVKAQRAHAAAAAAAAAGAGERQGILALGIFDDDDDGEALVADKGPSGFT